MSRSTNGDSLGAKVLLALATVLLMLGGTEIALSWLYPIEYLRLPEKSPGDFFYGLLHRPSEYPELLYELVPNQQKKFERVWIRTNSYGMRDAEPQPYDDGVPRIVVLGDSFSFGFRVEGEAAYPSVLERGSGRSRAGSLWRFSTWESVATARATKRPYYATRGWSGTPT